MGIHPGQTDTSCGIIFKNALRRRSSGGKVEELVVVVGWGWGGGAWGGGRGVQINCLGNNND